MPRKKVKTNDPTEWTRSWHQEVDPLDTYGSSTFPRDGRETIYDPYEALAPTGTVGEYALASYRVEDGDTTRPADFGDYLQQRVQSPPWMRSCESDDEIDRVGDVAKAKSSRDFGYAPMPNLCTDRASATYAQTTIMLACRYNETSMNRRYKDMSYQQGGL